jgi:hypothetical protein
MGGSEVRNYPTQATPRPQGMRLDALRSVDSEGAGFVSGRRDEGSIWDRQTKIGRSRFKSDQRA